MAEQKKIQGWRDVQITLDMPLPVLVNFLNVLNQRLATIEDQVVVDFEGSKKTLTEVYKIQSEREAAEMAQQQEEQMPDNPQHINEGE